MWLCRETTGEAPQAQSLTGVVCKEQKLVTFGGVLKGKAVNDLHLLDLGKWRGGEGRYFTLLFSLCSQHELECS